MNVNDLKSLIREVPDWPKKGILFYDITTLLRDPAGSRALLDHLFDHYDGTPVDLVVGIEARGFIFAPWLAYRLNAGFVPLRKPGKLPSSTVKEEYALEYGADALEVHDDAIEKGQRVLIVDDLLATGGTAAAAVKLVQKTGGEVAGCCFAIELTFLNGRDKLDGVETFSLMQYDS